MVDWSDSFWGDGNRGFEILSSNIKNGAIAIDEFQRFLTESTQCEAIYSKNFSRLQSQFLKSSYVGTFTPIWNLLRQLIDKIASTHLSTVSIYQDLLRDIHNYQELYQKKVKAQIQKDGDINRTTDLINQLHNALNTVNKAKEQYYSIALEYERAKRNGNNSGNSSSNLNPQDNTSTSLTQSALNSLTSRHIDRIERKYRQAQDEYKLTIEKYNLIRNDYEKRFSDASLKFQAFEIDHIEKMLVFSLNFSELLQRNNEQIRIAQNEFTNKLKSLTGNDLLDAFVEQKRTGTDRPVILQFEDIDHLKNSMALTSESMTNQDEMNLTNQTDFNLPSFQAHFSLPPSRSNETNRSLSTHSPSNDPTLSSSNNPTSPGITSLPMNSSTTRTQDGNDQQTNPFDVIIKKSKFPAFFGSKRPTKDKKLEKKTSIDGKSRKIPHIRRTRDDNNGTNSRNSNELKSTTDNKDEFNQISTNKRDTQSSSSVSNDDTYRYDDGVRRGFPSSKSSSSSDTSDDDDDDDDNPMTKIFVKINQPKTQVVSDEDDETRISTAMRLVDLNLGNFASNSRGLPNRNTEMNKSSQIDTRARPVLTITNASIDHSNMFPSEDEFTRATSNQVTNRLNQSESDSTYSQSQSENKNTTSLSSNDDDKEVANSFPNIDSFNKTTTTKSFPILQAPHLHSPNQQTTPISPINYRNSPMTPNEMVISPMTVGALDQIPLAIAFQEKIHVTISGDNSQNWKCRIDGDMLIAFPSLMLNLFIDPSRSTNPLEFQIKNLDNITNIIPKPSLLFQNESSMNKDNIIYSFNMIELNNILRNLQEKNSTSPYFNLHILKYQLKHFDQSNIPLKLFSQWTRTFDTVSVQIKYQFNSSSLSDSFRFTNNSVIIYSIIQNGQTIKESTPTAEWSENQHKLWWKIPYENNGTGQLSASIQLSELQTNETIDEPWTTSSIVEAYFIGENSLFSSIDFELISRDYRVSLLRTKIFSGKYQCEENQNEPINFFKRPSKSPPLSDTSLNPSGI